MRRTAPVLGLIAAVAALLAPAPALAGPAQADAELDQSIHSLLQMPHGPPGVAVVVQRGKQRRLHSFGTGTLGGHPIELTDHARIASVSKAFSGAVALKLVQRGLLRLDDPIGPHFAEYPAIWAPITLRQLLAHTSGLLSFPADPGFQAYVGAHLKDYISPEQDLSFITDDPLLFPPGSTYHYSNTDNILIGLLAQRVTGLPYDRLLNDLVFKPLKLRNTSLPTGLDIPSPFVRGYDFGDPGDPPEDVTDLVSPSSAWASGALISTQADLNRFIRGWAGRKFLPRNLRREQRRFIPDSAGEPPGPGINGAGLTLFRYHQECGTVLGHTGNYPGYTQFIAATPDGKRSTTVLANEQLEVKHGPPGVFPALREVFGKAACAALAGRG